MKIAFISIGFDPFRASGLDISGERLVGGLLERGHQVSVIAARKAPVPERIAHSNLQIHRLPIGASNWIAWGWRAARLVSRLERSQSFEAVHFWDVYFAWAYRGRFIGSLQHSFRQRLATSPEASPLKKMYYLLAMAFAERPAIHRAHGLLAGSASSLQAYSLHYDIPPEKAALAPHGIDTRFFSRVSDTQNLRKRWGIRPEEKVLLYAGFFTPRKGLTFLAQALQRMDPTPRLVLTGRWEPGFRQRFLDALGDRQARLIEAGFVPDEDMPAYFSMADLYVSPSLLEGFGLPIAEALACGTPAVGADTGSVAEVIGPGGVVVPPRDPAALAAAVTRLLADANTRQDLGAAGRAHIEKNFSLDRMVEATLQGYRRFSENVGGRNGPE